MKRSSDVATILRPKLLGPSCVWLICERRGFGKTKPNGRSVIGTAESSTFAAFISGPQRTSDARLKEKGLWTSKIRILNGAFWRTNRSYRFSLPIWQKRNQNFWTGYSKYSRNTTHWALMSRTTLIQPHTQSSLSKIGRASCRKERRFRRTLSH